MRTRILTIGLAAAGLGAVLALGGCNQGSTAAAAPPPAATAAPLPPLNSPPPSDVTCAGLDADLVIVLSDLKVEDAQLQEAWVTGGDSDALQSLINDTQPALNGTTPLDQDAATFNTDATQYLNQNDPDLVPGWQAGYGQVTDDINLLATDCGLATVPANTPANS